MRKVLFLICCLCLTVSIPAQEQGQAKGIDIISQKLEKANKALSKKLDKINKKLTKKLLKSYPQLKGVNIDSLLEERVYQKGKLQRLQQGGLVNGLDSAVQIDPLSKLKVDTLFNDSTLRAIQKIKAQLTGEMDQTPSALDIHQEMGESLAKLGKTEELLKELQVPSFPELPNLEFPELPSVPDLKELMPTKYLDDLKSSMADMGKLFDEYKGQFKDWDKELLARATSLEEVKLLQEQKKHMDTYKPLPEGYRDNMDKFQTNDFVKEKLQAKVEEIKKAGGKTLQERFNEAQGKLDKAKQKFNAIDRPEGSRAGQNPYKGKPFVKRLIFGGNLQVNRQAPTSLDAALQLSYLMNARTRLGIGGSYRINFGDNILNPNFDQQVIGTRSFLDYTVFRSVFLEATYELNSADVLSQDNIAQGRQWVQSGMLGAGNRFTLPKGIKANVTTLYNFFHDQRSPNPSPWVVRLGFEF